ncbi:MAG TPA: MxaL protein [Ramlibacter sp.]|uniref:MxaL protein n=1 Tax=Ramlibacter sp. TaxID=1917967 RepID=UPI002D7F4935|nr:MxaL protein [Ramlibacter sp.]HET8747683.1 MxaL protein [Ramlibacter sp.]
MKHWLRESLLLVAALALLALAVALPPLKLQRERAETVLVFDITQSMDVEDVELDGVRVSRLAFAREAARRALAELPCGARVGWAAFTEYRTVLLLAPVEVCENYEDLLATLAGIDGRMRWGNASEVAKGLFWAVRAARELGSHPALVFLTDGHEAPPLHAFPNFEDVQPGQVGGWLLGIGGSVPQPIPRTDGEGQRIGYWRAVDVLQRPALDGQPPSREHLSELREAHLRRLAARTGLGYAPLRDPAALPRLLADSRFARPAQVATDLHLVPAALALLLLCLYFSPLAPRRRRRTSGT